jgi:very-short-patch-repair endonuclease
VGTKNLQPWSGRAWALVRRQHGVVTRRQLLELGMSAEAIRHRLASGRLHRVAQGIYAVGRPELSRRGRWMAAVLACGPRARLSHRSAAVLWGIRLRSSGAIDVAIPYGVARGRPGLRVHRQAGLTEESLRVIDGIPVNGPVSTLVDLATVLPTKQLEAAVSEADHLDLVDPEELREALGSHPRRLGLARLRRMLDRETFVMTDTELERRFLPIVRSASLPLPETQVQLNGYRVDFYWRDLGLIVEADSLRYHRTAFKQSADQRRDHAHTSGGLTTLRFSHAQVRYEPEYVKRVLVANFERLAGNG